MQARLRGFQLPLRFAQTLNKLGIRRFGQANLPSSARAGSLAGRFAEQADTATSLPARQQTSASRGLSGNGSPMLILSGTLAPSGRISRAPSGLTSQSVQSIASGRSGAEI